MPELFTQFIDLIYLLFDFLLNIDQHLNVWLGYFGPYMYVILFLIIFCETGLVIMPFLPGDSLLFALGALCALPDAALNLQMIWATLMIAAILGDAVNYKIGNRIGPKVFHEQNPRFFKREHLVKAQAFYERHGGKTIVIARFMPFVRTFAPFVAGVAKMRYRDFAFYNVTGAFVWITTFLLAGFFFGNLPTVQQNFHIIIVAIIVISVAPAIIEWFRATRKSTT